MFQLSFWTNVCNFYFFFFSQEKIQLFLIIKQYCRNLSFQCESINYYVTSLADFRTFNHSIIITYLEVSEIQLPHSSHTNLLSTADNSYSERLLPSPRSEERELHYSLYATIGPDICKRSLCIYMSLRLSLLLYPSKDRPEFKEHV